MGYCVQEFSQLSAKVLAAACLRYVTQKRFEVPYKSPSAYISTVSVFFLLETVQFWRFIPQVSFIFTG